LFFNRLRPIAGTGDEIAAAEDFAATETRRPAGRQKFLRAAKVFDPVA
jgi:hypothetical protein